MIVELLIRLIFGFFKVAIFPVFSISGDFLIGAYNMTLGSIVGVSQFVNAGFGILSFLTGSVIILSSIIALNTSLTVFEIGASFAWWILGKIPFINVQKK